MIWEAILLVKAVKEAMTVDKWPLEVNDKYLSLGTDRTLMPILEEGRKEV